MEIFCKERAPYSHIYLSLPTPGERDSLYAKLLEQEGTPKIPKNFFIYKLGWYRNLHQLTYI